MSEKKTFFFANNCTFEAHSVNKYSEKGKILHYLQKSRLPRDPFFSNKSFDIIYYIENVHYRSVHS